MVPPAVRPRMSAPTNHPPRVVLFVAPVRSTGCLGHVVVHRAALPCQELLFVLPAPCWQDLDVRASPGRD